MGMTWGEIKSVVSAIAPDAVGSLVGTSGSPSQVASFAFLVGMRVASYPHKFKCMLRNGSVTLDGSGEYDLGALLPDLQVPMQVWGQQVGGREIGYRSLPQFNVTVGGTLMTIMGKTLKVAENGVTGTLNVPYYSNYLVLDEDGATRKRFFENDNDQSVLYDDMMPLFTEGIMAYIERREKEKDWSKFLESELARASLNDRPITRAMFDWRFLVN